MMRRRKPVGWPSYLTGKKLSAGRIAYYWQPPTWARKLDCPIQAEALGADYAEGKRRCDDILNPQFRAWLHRNELVGTGDPVPSTFAWLVGVYKTSPLYLKCSGGTRADYDAVLSVVVSHVLRDGRNFGKLTFR